MTLPALLAPDELLSHKTFIQSVVRGVLRDDSDVQDAVQETWIAAMRSADQVETNPRGWLRTTARRKAFELKRSRKRREHREATYARPEVDDSIEASRERLEVHSGVVQAVLALDDPYRSAVLMRYFQGLEPKVIAERLGVKASTVRSQLSRAHDQLRDRLDQQHDRSQWAALAFPVAGLKSTAIGASTLASWWLPVAGVAAVAAVTFVGLGLSGMGGEPDPALTTSLALAPIDARAPSSSTLEASLPTLAKVPPGASRSAVAPDPGLAATQDAGSALPQARADAAQTLQRRATWLQRAIQERLLTPSPELVEQHAAFLEASPNHGIARVLSERGSIRGVSHALPLEGNGAYYSFATREHSYQAAPDISFSQRQFSTGFNGGQNAALIALGPLPLDSIPTSPTSPIPGFDRDEQASWAMLWTDVSSMDKNSRRTFDAELRKEFRRLPPTRAGESYVVRMIDQNEHDHIVAFQLLDTDAYGCTILWRKLAEWPMAVQGQAYREPKSEVAPAPKEWLARIADLSVEDLLDQLKATRDELVPMLLAVPDELRAAYEKRTGAGADRFGVQGMTRLLRRGSSSAIVNVREGGAYFGFQTEERGYGSESDLQLGGYGEFSTGFAGGDDGWIIDLGVLDDTSLKAGLAGQNPFTAGHTSELWDFVTTAEVEVKGRRKKLTEASEARSKELGLTHRASSAECKLGHTYLLRTALYDDHDVTVLFTVLAVTADSAAIAWRVLE